MSSPVFQFSLSADLAEKYSRNIVEQKFPQGFGDRPLPALWTPGRPGQLGRVLSRDQVAGGECSSGKKEIARVLILPGMRLTWMAMDK